MGAEWKDKIIMGDQPSGYRLPVDEVGAHRYRMLLDTIFAPFERKVEAEFFVRYDTTDGFYVVMRFNGEDQATADFAQFVRDHTPRSWTMNAGDLNLLRSSLDEVLHPKAAQIKELKQLMAEAAQELRHLMEVVMEEKDKNPFPREVLIPYIDKRISELIAKLLPE